MVAALAGAQLLVAVRSAPGPDRTPHGAHPGDGAELALALLTGADGRRALPAFTSTAALSAWDPAARPVPVDCARAALSAVAEGCDALVLDAAGLASCVIRRAAVWALAQGRPWLPPEQDAAVRAAVQDAVAGLPEIRGARCEPGERAELRMVLGVEPGLSADRLAALLDAVQAGLAGQQALAERVDSLELTVLPG